MKYFDIEERLAQIKNIDSIAEATGAIHGEARQVAYDAEILCAVGLDKVARRLEHSARLLQALGEHISALNLQEQNSQLDSARLLTNAVVKAGLALTQLPDEAAKNVVNTADQMVSL